MSDYEELVSSLRDKACYYMTKGVDTDLALLLAEAIETIETLEKKVNEWMEDACRWNNDYYAISDSLPKWHAVEDELPAEPGEYLVYLRYHDLVEGQEDNDWQIELGVTVEGMSFVTEMCFDQDQMLWFDDGSTYNAVLSAVNRKKVYAVTHWMEMPSGPYGEREERG